MRLGMSHPRARQLLFHRIDSARRGSISCCAFISAIGDILQLKYVRMCVCMHMHGCVPTHTSTLAHASARAHKPRHTTPRLAVPHQATPWHTMPCHAMPRHGIPHHTTPHQAAPRHATQHMYTQSRICMGACARKHPYGRTGCQLTTVCPAASDCRCNSLCSTCTTQTGTALSATTKSSNTW